MLLWWVRIASYISHTTYCAEYTNSFVHSWQCVKHTELINISRIWTLSLSRDASSSRELLDMLAVSPGSRLFKKQQEKHNSGAQQRWIRLSYFELYNVWMESHSHQLFTHSGVKIWQQKLNWRHWEGLQKRMSLLGRTGLSWGNESLIYHQWGGIAREESLSWQMLD